MKVCIPHQLTRCSSALKMMVTKGGVLCMVQLIVSVCADFEQVCTLRQYFRGNQSPKDLGVCGSRLTSFVTARCGRSPYMGSDSNIVSSLNNRGKFRISSLHMSHSPATRINSDNHWMATVIPIIRLIISTLFRCSKARHIPYEHWSPFLPESTSELRWQQP